MRYNLSVVGTSSYNRVCQNIEDVRTFAGQTVTVSMWLKSSTTQNVSINLSQIFGSGGSSENYFGNSNFNITTSWARYSATFAVPSVSGKTIGTSSYLKLFLELNASSTYTTEIWGAQLEAGSVATAFQTATGTIQGELAACQRYYYLTSSADGSYTQYGMGQAYSTTAAKFSVPFPVTMRIAPTSVVATGNIGALNINNTAINNGTIAIDSNSNNRASLVMTATSGIIAGNATTILSNGSTSTSLAFSAEL